MIEVGRATLVVFLGGLGGSPVEEMVGAARRAASLDTIETALASGAFAGSILVTDAASVPGEVLPHLTVHFDAGPFHFGCRLAEVVREYRLEGIVYLGGGSLPLLSADELVSIARALEGEQDIGITNNYFSCDLAAFPARALDRIEPPDSDNAFARALSEQAGLAVHTLPRTVSTQLDIDSPTDLAVLSLSGQGGPRLRSFLASTALDLSSYRLVLPLFTDRTAEIMVAGRVGSYAWQYLERETACRVRLFAEERGMQADARLQAGDVRSLLGFYLEEVGCERLFEALAQLSDAAFLDTRVLLGHLGIEASRADRFLSDLGRWEEIQQPFLREFTKAAGEAPIPVLLGGHSLMSGGLMALNEFAWREHDRKQSPNP